MAKITDFACFFDGKIKLKADPQGNNVAFACPSCGYPVIAVTLDEKQRGMPDAKNPSKCRGCGITYRIKIIDEKQKQLVIRQENKLTGDK